MNKSDIMKAAEEAAECNLTSCELKPSYARACQALIAAAELLKQVEVLEEGCPYQIGDTIITIDGFARTINDEDLVHLQLNNYKRKIIARNNQPTVYRR